MLKEITYQLVIKLVSEIFELIIPRLSEHIRELLTLYIRNLYKKAKATDNIFDDFAIELIAKILLIDLSEDSSEHEEEDKEEETKVSHEVMN
jgi:hypothetical protein